MNTPPVVSIIMPCFNKALYVAEAIASVQAQSISQWELLVLDDFSQDGSVPIIKRYSSTDRRVRLFEHTTNRGANVLRNDGLKSAAGQYVVFFDADDILAPKCLELRLEKIQSNPELDFSVSAMQVFQKFPGDRSMMWQPREDALTGFLSHNLPWQTMQPIWKRDFLLRLGGWDEKLPRLQDVDLHTRALLHPGVKYSVFPGKPDCFLRIDENRKNYSQDEFLAKWIEGCRIYYIKFHAIVGKAQRRSLVGVIFRTDMQLALSFRQSLITAEVYRNLRHRLYDGFIRSSISRLSRRMLDFGAYYNTSLPRIPGLNSILWKILTLV